MRASRSLISKTSPTLGGGPLGVLRRCRARSSTMTLFGRRMSSSFPDKITAGRPTRLAESSPTQRIGLKLPSANRAWRMLTYRGTAHATPGTERTRLTSVSRRGFNSLTCSTLASTTQILERILDRWLVVHESRPKKTAHCCVMRRAAKNSPPRSMKNLALSPISILSAR